jgi:hypothetical protein
MLLHICQLIIMPKRYRKKNIILQKQLFCDHDSGILKCTTYLYFPDLGNNTNSFYRLQIIYLLNSLPNLDI